ncbi:MFS transporter [Thermomonospora amylolytica]|uniref:MFS transporter n=1 Tax=Thermomonospora amylolytica TaxID=1411117 RepID=UPI000E6D4FC8|nr:MFS transporter [Thermomonospora amylolytica]
MTGIVPGPRAETASPPWQGVFARLCAVLLLTFTAFGSAVPVLPRLITDDLDGSGLAVGAAFTCSALAALLARPYVGRFAQRAGARPVIAAGTALAVVVGAAYGPAALLGTGVGTAALLAVRILMGLAEAAVFTAGSLWVVTLAPAGRRGQLVGWYGLAMWGGWTLGPVIGEALRREAGYGAVWLLHVLLPAAAAVTALRLPPHRPGSGEPSRRLVPRSALLPGTALALAAVGYSALAGFAVLYLDDRGLGGGSLLLGLFGTAYIAVRLAFGRLPDRVGAARIAVVCGLLEATGLVMIALAPGLWVAATGALVMGAGFTLLYPSLALLVIDRSAPADQGAALGAYTSFWDLGLGAAGLLTGAIAAGLGHREVFAAAALTAATAALAGGAAGRRRSAT